MGTRRSGAATSFSAKLIVSGLLPQSAKPELLLPFLISFRSAIIRLQCKPLMPLTTQLPNSDRNLVLLWKDYGKRMSCMDSRIIAFHLASCDAPLSMRYS